MPAAMVGRGRKKKTSLSLCVAGSCLLVGSNGRLLMGLAWPPLEVLPASPVSASIAVNKLFYLK